MNKYRKALNAFSNINEYYGNYKVFDKPIEKVQEDYNLLNELVEKEIPKQVIKVNYLDCCPKCGDSYHIKNTEYNDMYNYCGKCGQKLKEMEDE